MDGQVFREVFSYSQRYGLKSFEKIINEEKKTICFKNKLTFDHKEGNTVYPIVMYRSEYVFFACDHRYRVDTDDTNVENEYLMTSVCYSIENSRSCLKPSRRKIIWNLVVCLMHAFSYCRSQR